MTEAFNVFDPPESDKHYGFVVGRIIRRVSDTTLDQDSYPDAANVKGTVKFAPMEKVAKSENYKAIMFREPIYAPLDDHGFITNASMTVRGVWLTVGFWEVSFLLDNKTLQPFVIEVDETYDEASPLDISDQKPATPIMGTPTTLLSLPAGGVDGDILVKNADGTTSWASYILRGVTLEDLRGPKGDQGDTGDTGPSGPSGGVLSENMLANGLFELGTMQYMSNGTIVKTDLPVDNGVPFKISYPFGAMSPNPTYPPVPITGSETYMIEYWVKASKPNAWVYMSLRDENLGFLQVSETIGGPEHSHLLAETDRVPTTWQRKVAYLRRTTSSSAVNRAAKYLNFRYFTLNTAQPGSTVATDADFEFGGIRIRPVAPSVVNNRSISQDKLALDAIGDKSNLIPDSDSFGPITWPDTSATRTVPGGGRVSGTNARRVTTNGVGLTGGYSSAFAIQPGTYRLSGYVKPSATIPESASGGAVGLHAISTQVAFTRSSLPANVWTKIEGVFTVPEATKFVAIGTYAQPSVPAGTTVDFSDIAIKAVPDMAVVPDGAIEGSQIKDGTVTPDKLDPPLLESMQNAVGGYPRSIKEWGATGNNVDDDTPAFERAIAELGPGGALFIPPGSYRITRSLTMPTDSLWMGFGANQQVQQASTTIRSEVADGPALIVNSANVERFAVTGPGYTTASVGIQSKGSMLCRDMKVWDFGKGIYMDQNWYTKIERIQMRYNAVGIEANYCYNLVLDDPRISTSSRANNSAGTDLYLTSGNMVNVHGGAFEGYQNAVHMDGGKQSITFFGTYFETAVPGVKDAYGVLLSQGASQVNLFGTQVYLNKHAAFVGASSGSVTGSVINGIGNKFKSSADVSTYGMTGTCAYKFAPSMTAVNVFGDDWWNVTHAGYSYRNGTGTGPGMYLDPYTVAPPEGGAANGVNFGGAYIGSSNNRMIALGNSGLPGSAPKSGTIVWDPATKKLAVWNGSSWRDALGNAL